MHSNSAAMVQELIRFYAPALEMLNRGGQTPLCLINLNTTPEAQSLLTAAPQVAQMVNPETRQLPLNDILQSSGIPHPPPEVISALVDAYPDAVNIDSGWGYLPIHCAAERYNVAIFKLIYEANLNNITAISPVYGSVADRAVEWHNLDNLRYIHQRIPELLTAPNSENYTLLERLFRSENEHQPDVGRVEYLQSPVSEFSDIFRFLLPLHASTEIAGFGEGLLNRLSFSFDDDESNDDDDEIRTDVDDENDSYGWQYARRLLLRAGAPFLLPDLVKKLNYIARRGALLAFFGRTVAGKPPTIVYRIRHGAGGAELMQTIIEFL